MIVTINRVYNVTSEYNSIDNAHGAPHTGVDLAMNVGTPIYAPSDGVIDNIVNYGDKNIGLGVIIKNPDGSHLVLGHLSKVNVKAGDVIHSGQKIAESGNSGNSTGAHLHMGLVDTSGHFSNPSHYEQMFQQVASEQNKNFFQRSWDKVSGAYNGATDDIHSIGSFLQDSKQNGIYHALTGHFFGDSVHNLGISLRDGLLNCDDVVFLLPTVTILFVTLFIGKNKALKYVLPLMLGYFVTEVIKVQIQVQGGH